MDLKPAPKDLGHTAISNIKMTLDRLFGVDTWKNWEPETITLELGMVLDELTLDKINVLKVLAHDPRIFYTDMAFLLHATDVMNNLVADFERLPAPTSLELAFALVDVAKVVQAAPLSEDESLIDTLAFFLREEGYSEPVYPFGFIPKELLESGQSKEDTDAKKKAISQYIEGMYAL